MHPTQTVAYPRSYVLDLLYIFIKSLNEFSIIKKYKSKKKNEMYMHMFPTGHAHAQAAQVDFHFESLSC